MSIEKVSTISNRALKAQLKWDARGACNEARKIVASIYPEFEGNYTSPVSVHDKAEQVREILDELEEKATKLRSIIIKEVMA